MIKDYTIKEEFFESKLQEILVCICTKTIPKEWYDDNCPYDSSGSTKYMTKERFTQIKNKTEITIPEIYESVNEEILDSINTGNTKATYTSGCGLSHETYLEKLKEDFEYWIYETYAIFDEDGEYYEDAEDFEYSLHDVIAKFIEELDLTFYLKLIERNIYSRIQ